MEKETNNLKQSILEKLEAENLTPKAKLWFSFFEGLTWVIWFLLLVVSAITLAVGLFSLKYSKYSYFSNNESGFVFFVDFLPYIWFFLLSLMTLGTMFVFRFTKRGYRYKWWQVVGASLALSFLVGLGLGVLEFGLKFDQWLGKSTEFYSSREEFSVQFWQKPEEGRLLGYFTELSSAGNKEAAFFDAEKNLWQMKIDELSILDRKEVKDGELVAVLGFKTDSAQFYACNVLPWFFAREYSYRELQSYKQRVEKGFSRSLPFSKFLEDTEKASDNREQKEFCHELEIKSLSVEKN